MRILRTRRLYNIAFFVILVGITFLALQWLSFNMLHAQSSSEKLQALVTADYLLKLTEKKCEKGECKEDKFIQIKKPESVFKEIIHKKSLDNTVLEKKVTKRPVNTSKHIRFDINYKVNSVKPIVSKNVVRGASPLLQEYYIPNAENQFQCITSNVSFICVDHFYCILVNIRFCSGILLSFKLQNIRFMW